MCKAGQVSQAEAARRCGVSWISTILNSTTEPTLGRPLSSQYRSSTNSYIFLKAIAVSIFRNKCPCGTISSKLTNFQLSSIFALFTSFFITLYHYTAFFSPIREKRPPSGDLFRQAVRPPKRSGGPFFACGFAGGTMLPAGRRPCLFTGAGGSCLI